MSIAIALALLQTASIPPPPIFPHYYYGPVRMCAGALAADVRAGEGYESVGSSEILNLAEGRIGIQGWMYDDDAYRDIAAPLGKVAVPGFGTLERWSLGSRNRPGRWTGYVYQAGPNSRLEITSDRFDGSDADFAVLRRIATGDAATAMCAEIPAALRATPEREVPMMLWFAPKAYPGRRTLCTTSLALDIADGEQAVLPWIPLNHFGVDRDGVRIGVFGDFYPARDKPLPKGALLDDAGFVLEATPQAKDARVAYHTLKRLSEPHSSFNVTFAYTPGTPEAAVRGVAQRLRARRPDDRCLSPEPR
ncbi:hypothetical protein FHS95_001179 [Sphingomonas naasensis]|uniref:Uncharacterized protein n=1 Tax=Sphingomonas naasensis TaxID=1344951 RepID=A0A4S1WBA6_9SPHN|nr:hypothetical protein [Sphingomonas naasensis]NIJ19510.1 hypothetical protein [Sphingomonas naasensis]TGX39245.1 hypothetical protein E5A74_17160 [Sphingomonas naasensis]